MKDMNQAAACAYFDFSKAFDRKPHHLLKKIICIRFLLIFHQITQSYLDDRTQCVKIIDEVSSTMLATSDLPQGSILGHLLFASYINHLTDDIFPLIAFYLQTIISFCLSNCNCIVTFKLM